MILGRSDEIERALAGLRERGVVTVIGGPGVGKSALARETASRHDGDVAVFDASRSREGIVTKIRESHEAGVGVVVEARGPLGVSDETVIALSPLNVDAAAALFVRASGRPAPDPRALTELVGLLDGNPLAIELAAGRASVLGLAELTERLNDPVRLLGPRFETSFVAALDDLDAEERTGLACACTFEGVFTADAFEVTTREALHRDPLDVAESLMKKGLLFRVEEDGAVRLGMPRLMRAFARRVLDVSLPLARHARYVIDRATKLASRAYGDGASSALDELEILAPEVLAACDRAAPALAVRAWLSLFDAIVFRQVVDLDDRRFDAMVEAADRTGDPDARARTRILRSRARLEIRPPSHAESDAKDALGVAPSPHVAAEAKRALGWALIASGRPDEAVLHLDEAFEGHAAHGDVRGQADALAATGLALSLSGKPEAGAEKLAVARAIHAGENDELRKQKVEEMQRLLFAYEGEEVAPDAAASALRASASVHSERGQKWREALDLALLAQILAARGESAEAEALRVRARSAAAASGVAVPEASAGKAAAWTVGGDARFLTAPGGERRDLSRHGPLRRVLDALVTARLEAPNRALSADAVLAAGWPDEKMRHDAGMLRVYSIVRRLRALGLEEALVTRDDGYLLDPKTRFVRAP